MVSFHPIDCKNSPKISQVFVIQKYSRVTDPVRGNFQTILMVSTKLPVIISRMGLRIQERGDVVKGTPVVQPGDDLFWFNNPKFMLFCIHFCLFLVSVFVCCCVESRLQILVTQQKLNIPSFLLSQNAFQLAFFAWSWVSILKSIHQPKYVIRTFLRYKYFLPHLQYEFGLTSCYHKTKADVTIRISMG